MSKPKSGGRWLVTGAACMLVLVAANVGPAPSARGDAGRCGRFERAADVRAASVASPVPVAIDDAAGGWRPKRPLVCAGAMILSAMAGAAVNVVAPGGGAAVLVAMLPFLVDACQ